jgi:hypothetical protein
MIAIHDQPQQPRPYGIQPIPKVHVEEHTRVARCILIAEHRDEVFARLAHDLGAMGCVVFRATRAEEVLYVHSYSAAILTLCNYELPDASGWLTATKLQMFRACSRVWLYAPQQSAVDVTWARLSGVERVLYYQGDLFRLAEQVKENMLKLNLRSRYPSAPSCHRTELLSHPRNQKP